MQVVGEGKKGGEDLSLLSVHVPRQKNRPVHTVERQKQNWQENFANRLELKQKGVNINDVCLRSHLCLTFSPFLFCPILLKQVTRINSRMQLNTKIMEVSIQMSRKEM